MWCVCCFICLKGCHHCDDRLTSCLTFTPVRPGSVAVPYLSAQYLNSSTPHVSLTFARFYLLYGNFETRTLSVRLCVLEQLTGHPLSFSSPSPSIRQAYTPPSLREIRAMRRMLQNSQGKRHQREVSTAALKKASSQVRDRRSTGWKLLQGTITPA